jgi:hypothetical protein
MAPIPNPNPPDRAPSMASMPKPPAPPRPKSRGSYNCGRCGQPKKGHVCVAPAPVALSPSPSSSSGAAASGTGGGDHSLRRALSFDKKKPKAEELEDGDDEAMMNVAGRLVPKEVMAEVLRRLGPRGVLAAAEVSRAWRDCAARVWRATEELRLRAAAIGILGALLPRCTALARLLLRMER